MSHEQVTTEAEAKPRKTRSANIPVSVKIAALRKQSENQLARAQKAVHSAQDALNKAMERLSDAEKSATETGVTQ